VSNKNEIKAQLSTPFALRATGAIVLYDRGKEKRIDGLERLNQYFEGNRREKNEIPGQLKLGWPLN
jgi:hypothetical protein